MNLIDTHAHVDFPEFEKDLDQVVARAVEAGVDRILTIGVDLESSRRAIHLAENIPCVYAAVGWHPNYCANAPDDVISPLRELALHPKVVAIGETGLDYHRLPGRQMEDPMKEAIGIEGVQDPQEIRRNLADGECMDRQKAVFRAQLDLAEELGLSVIIHQREAFEDCHAIMKEYRGRVRGVWHCFVDSPALATRVLDMGGLVSFTGIVTFKNAAAVRETAATVPLDRMLIETDCPFLAPEPGRGKRCEPAHVARVAEKIALLKDLDADEVARVTTSTARGFFKW